LEILVLEIGNFGFKKQKFWDGGRYYISLPKTAVVLRVMHGESEGTRAKFQF
jgi:hypothetical protein